MQLIVPIHDIKHLDRLSDASDGLFFGHQQFGTRLTSHYDINQIQTMINHLHLKNRAAYLIANRIMTDHELETFEIFLKQMDTKKLTGIVVGDIGAVVTLCEMGLSHLAIYHPETLITNHHDFNVLKDLNIQGAFISKEITLDEIIEIGHQKAHRMFMVGHGHLNMFYSKRQLIKNHLTYYNIPGDLTGDMALEILESVRPNEPLKILEDDAGTHVFRHHVFHTEDVLEQLKPWVDVMFIDTLFKDDAYAIDILNIYHATTHQAEKIQALKTAYQETWDHGFLYQKTIYKQSVDDTV